MLKVSLNLGLCLVEGSLALSCMTACGAVSTDGNGDITTLTELSDHTDEVHCVALSPRGTLLATGGDDSLVSALNLWKPDMCTT